MDTHFTGFQKLGAKFNYDAKNEIFHIDGKNLKGCYMLLDEASVTGTANIVMAAAMAEGTTTVYNAACEPYLQQLCDMLNRMGAKITGVGSNLLTIEGVKKLGGTTHKIFHRTSSHDSIRNHDQRLSDSSTWDYSGNLPKNGNPIGIPRRRHFRACTEAL